MDIDTNPSWSELSSETLIKALRSFQEWRKSVLDMRVNDNAGAIHSAERIAELLSLKIAYPKLSHINNLRDKEFAWFSKKAKIAYERKETVQIEHVFPKRAYTVELLSIISKGTTNEEIAKWIRENFKLALLTPDERSQLDKENRTKHSHNRLAGILMCDEPSKPL